MECIHLDAGIDTVKALQKRKTKMNRRKFIRTLGLSGLGLYLLPSFLRREAKAFSSGKPEFIPATSWLYGSPQKGCSTSTLATEFHGKIENGLDDWANFRFVS